MNTLFTLLFGPTASGKTAWALNEAQKTGAWILSADSRQVYEGLDIVSGKDIPDGYRKELWNPSDASLPVYRGSDTDPMLFGFDLVKPDQDFSVGHYIDAIQPLIRYCRQNQQPLIIVGGTWQYLEALIAPPASLFVPPLAALRDELSQLDITQLQTRLRTADSETWDRLNESDQKNPRRLIRAIEVAESHGTTPLPKPLIKPDEYVLYLREKTLEQIEPLLEKRIDDRLENGALEETQQLLKRYSDWNQPAFTATGYKLLAEVLSNQITLEEAKKLWKLQERQYAKRQLTWLKKVRAQYPVLEAKLPDESNAATLDLDVGGVDRRHS